MDANLTARTATKVVAMQIDRLDRFGAARRANQSRQYWNAGGRERDEVASQRAYALQIVGYVAGGSMSIVEAEEMAQSAAASVEFRAAFSAAVDALLGA